MNNIALHAFSAVDINGRHQDFSIYRGKVVLAVNVASFCGFTKQYAALEQLHRTYASQGLAVIGFPSNDFGAQEPGSDAEIQQFCADNYEVTFDLYSKVVVKGEGKIPLFEWLAQGGGDERLAGEIEWNFEKFLIGRDGSLIKRYSTKVDPLGSDCIEDITSALRL